MTPQKPLLSFSDRLRIVLYRMRLRLLGGRGFAQAAVETFAWPLVLAFAVAMLSATRLVAWQAAMVGFAIFAFGTAVALRRERYSRDVQREDLAERDRRYLERASPFYRQLADWQRSIFAKRVATFLRDQRFSFVRGARPSRETQLLVAAAAVTIAFGFADYRYKNHRDIVIFAGGPFSLSADSEEENARYLGMVHGQGPIIFSEAALHHGFRGLNGQNVGYHEFAHVIDFSVDGNANMKADGIPSTLSESVQHQWATMQQLEMQRIRSGNSILRGYGAKNGAEFFAVSTEMFFELPDLLQAKHPEVYAALSSFYQQDLADAEAHASELLSN